jgi:tetratricopeptide (TPR) repeat protein
MDEAIRVGRRGRELDPLSPNIGASLGQTLHRAGRYQEALAVLEEVRQLDPDFLLTNSALGEVYLALGRPADAIRALEKALDPVVRHSAELGLLGYAYAAAGRRTDALRLLRELEERSARSYVSGTNVALLLTGLGDTTQAFRWLERAAQDRDPFLSYHFATHPLMEGLRRDPRGMALLQRMNLPPSR